jgi:hypothetical protein
MQTDVKDACRLLLQPDSAAICLCFSRDASDDEHLLRFASSLNLINTI